MRTASEDELIEIIEIAFANVCLDDGTSLNMAIFKDSGGSALHYAELAKSDERIDWHRVITPALASFQGTFNFTDLKGFRFYVPAYMIWTIRNHRTSSSIVKDFTIYAINPDHYLFRDVPLVKWFTPLQVAAMVAFLEYCVANDDSLDGHVARENLSKIQSRCQT
jgi:hypothetical protein